MSEETKTENTQGNGDLAFVSKSNSIEVETLAAKVFALANELAIAGYGNAAVKLHTVHNGMITKGHYYSCQHQAKKRFSNCCEDFNY